LIKKLFEKASDAVVHVQTLIRKWEAHFKEHPDNSLLCTWIHGNTFISNDEMEANIMMILFAATHNLENILGNGVRLMLKYPDQLNILKGDLSLIPNTIEEIMRYCPAIRIVPRSAKEDCTINNINLKKGQTILLSLWDANRDPTIFRNPDLFFVARPLETVSKHLTFGYGIHHCIGNVLGKVQLELILEELFLSGKYPQLRLADETIDPHWEHSYSKLESLKLLW